MGRAVEAQRLAALVLVAEAMFHHLLPALAIMRAERKRERADEAASEVDVASEEVSRHQPAPAPSFG
jgi:hypothetical protein